MKHPLPVTGWTLFFIIFYLAVPQIALDLYLPSIPSMVTMLHSTTSLIQLSVATYLVAMAISQFFYGPLSDSFGRKPIILFGCSVFIIGSLVCCLAHSIDILLLGRLIQGLGIGFGSVLSRAILRDKVQNKKIIAKIVSMQSMSWACVPLIAPVIGGYIQHWFSWRGNFTLLLMLGLLLLILSLLKLPETRLPKQRHPFNLIQLFRTYGVLLKRFRLIGYMLILALQYGSVMTLLQLAPFIFQTDLGFTPYTYGWLILLAGVGSFIGSFSNKIISQHFKLRHIILCALSLALSMTILMNILALHWFNAWIIIVPIFVMRISGGPIYANCIAEGLAQLPEHSGSIGSLYGIVITLGAALTSLVVAHIPQHKSWTLSGSLLVEIGLAMVVFVLIGFRRSK